MKALPERRGMCYEYAFAWVDNCPEYTLCHGTLTGPSVAQHDVDYHHAWAENEIAGLVYEPLVNKAFPLDEYYANTQPVDVSRYSAMSARLKVQTRETWGPWT